MNLKVVLFFLVFSSVVFGQNLEIGLGLGGTNTRTDMANLNPLNTRYGFQGFGRWNFTNAWVLRIDYKYMAIEASDKNNNQNTSPISSVRNHEFSNVIQQLSVNGEYNFLDFRSANKQVKFCPYLTGGLGVFKIEEYPEQYGLFPDGNYNFCIPFGLGVKYALTKNFNLGAMFEATKTFTDELENLSTRLPKNTSLKNRGIDEATNDWYFFLGFNLSYTLYTVNCPDFYNF